MLDIKKFLWKSHLVADPGSDLGELFPVDAAALGVQVEHGPLQVRAPKQHVVEVLEGGECDAGALALEALADPGQHLLLPLGGQAGGVEHVATEILLTHVLLHTAIPEHIQYNDGRSEIHQMVSPREFQ